MSPEPSNNGTLIGWSLGLECSSRADRSASCNALLTRRKGRLRRTGSSLSMGTDLGLWSLSMRVRPVRRVLAPLALLEQGLSFSDSQGIPIFREQCESCAVAAAEDRHGAGLQSGFARSGDRCGVFGDVGPGGRPIGLGLGWRRRSAGSDRRARPGIAHRAVRGSRATPSLTLIEITFSGSLRRRRTRPSARCLRSLSRNEVSWRAGQRCGPFSTAAA